MKVFCELAQDVEPGVVNPTPVKAVTKAALIMASLVGTIVSGV